MSQSPLRTVLLRHQLPDGSAHFDWMLQIKPGANAPLTSFRVDEPIFHPEIDMFDAEMIGSHRQMYLNYQGPLTDDRGFVDRVASGQLEITEASDSRIQVSVTWTPPKGGKGPRRSWIGMPTAGAVWRFVIDPSARADD